ncbi:gas vesicle protein GvpM [Halovivax limisalsi]|uniref:gas vesicle protein GvpM n=1 Tax=Halovivax limisalsi TaxID=1453760 RepID=UPI001FFC8A1E|nr:gas vesicle protein [Halovivax limisalsi]
MEPTSDDALVDLVDVLLRDGAVLRADVIVTVADVPLVGISLSAAIAGMETMNEYGLFEEWDGSKRARVVARRQYTDNGRPRHQRRQQRRENGTTGVMPRPSGADRNET